MSDEFGGDIITITDEDGKDYVLEHLDTLEMNGVFYMAFLPADVDPESDDYGMVIMKTESDNGEEYLVVPDDEETEQVYQAFMERLFGEEEEDD